MIAQVISPVAYKLELPLNLHIHPIFHVALLKRYTVPTSMPDRTPPNSPPDAVTIGDHAEFEVETILDKRTHRRRIEYLVKWAGYPNYDATWEPLANLANASNAIAEFEASTVDLSSVGVCKKDRAMKDWNYGCCNLEFHNGRSTTPNLEGGVM
jgi:hypothetical protein